MKFPVWSKISLCMQVFGAIYLGVVLIGCLALAVSPDAQLTPQDFMGMVMGGLTGAFFTTIGSLIQWSLNLMSRHMSP